MNRGTSKRSSCRPKGPSNALHYVVNANRMVSRVVLLAFTFVAVGCYVTIEQPANSLMILHERMQLFVSRVKVCCLATDSKVHKPVVDRLMCWFRRPTSWPAGQYTRHLHQPINRSIPGMWACLWDWLYGNHRFSKNRSRWACSAASRRSKPGCTARHSSSPIFMSMRPVQLATLMASATKW